MYEYKAKLARVVDGDTVYLLVDLGFRIQVTLDFRLLGINTPELRTPTTEAGLAAKAYLEGMIKDKPLTIFTTKPDKYGRWLVTIFVDGINVNESLLMSGHADVY